jgi:hypothetical protein
LSCSSLEDDDAVELFEFELLETPELLDKLLFDVTDDDIYPNISL